MGTKTQQITNSTVKDKIPGWLRAWSNFTPNHKC